MTQDHDPFVGKVIDGRYEIQQRVGEGGMGVVYKAIDRRLGTAAAVKVIHEHLRNEPGYLERFRREAHVASLLTSPYIVQVIEFGFDKDAYFLATEYVTGGTLTLRADGTASLVEARRLEERRTNGSTTSTTRTIDYNGTLHYGPIVQGGGGITIQLQPPTPSLFGSIRENDTLIGLQVPSTNGHSYRFRKT